MQEKLEMKIYLSWNEGDPVSSSHLWVTRLTRVKGRNCSALVYRGVDGKTWQPFFPWIESHHLSRQHITHRTLPMLTAAMIPTWIVPKEFWCLLEAHSIAAGLGGTGNPNSNPNANPRSLNVRPIGKQFLWDHGYVWYLPSLSALVAGISILSKNLLWWP